MNSPAPSLPLRDMLSDALRYWEPRRLVYNLVLTAVVVGYVVATWPHFRLAMQWFNLGQLFILAVLANVCYCAAYFVDVPVQISDFRAAWRRWRGAVWILGMLFAALIAFYWMADEIYPAVGN